MGYDGRQWKPLVLLGIIGLIHCCQRAIGTTDQILQIIKKLGFIGVKA